MRNIVLDNLKLLIIQVQTQTFNVPVGVTSVTVSAWGGGGCSGQNSGGFARGGGGGGAFTRGTIPVTPGNQLTVVVGAGGIYNTNSTTTDDGFASSVGPIVANGGSRGIIGNNVTINGGAGGQLQLTREELHLLYPLPEVMGEMVTLLQLVVVVVAAVSLHLQQELVIREEMELLLVLVLLVVQEEPEMRQVETEEEVQMMMVILIVLVE